MITVQHKGDFSKTLKFLKQNTSMSFDDKLRYYGEQGVRALSAATPKDSGETASHWSYVIKKTKGGAEIAWTNSNIQDGIPVAILIQYGHGTRNGGYVQGYNYINPALKPIFKGLSDAVWNGVSK